MLSHGQHTRDPSLTYRPPPPPPKDNPTPSQTSTGGHAKSASRNSIKRKPLPASAFSPRSIISSPDSIFSQYAEPVRQVEVPSSQAALNQVLESPPRRTNHNKTPEYQAIISEPADQYHPHSYPSEKITPGDISINDFPFPPQQRSTLNIVVPDEGTNKPLKQEEVMAPKQSERPPPLRVEPVKTVKALDAKKPQSPGGVFTSFFSRRQNSANQQVSPSGESSTTEISEGRSPLPSPYPGSADDTSSYFAQAPPFITEGKQHASPNNSLDSTRYDGRRQGPGSADLLGRCNVLEAELKEISRELAGSIRRELDLEDMVERLQMEAPNPPMSADRTSDYFSDSGTGSVRHGDAFYNPKDEIDKIRRESDQQRALMRNELSQKWQEEVTQRKMLEAHVQTLEGKLQETRRDTNDTPGNSSRVRDLEVAVDDARRRLNEERQTKENFEDLLSALKVDLEQHRNERDNLKDEVVPKLRSQIEGLESSLAETQRQTYDFARMQQEIQSLKDENAAISSARKMEQEIMRSGMGQIAEDDDLSSVRSSLVLPRSGGLGRSNTTSGRASTRGSLSRSGSLSKATSGLNRPLPETPESITEKLNAVEQQRDALHNTAKHMRRRLEHETKKYEKQIALMQARLDKAESNSEATRRGGYESEVRTLRQEINLLRKRADEALEQKWQCENGLVGIKMDLDRSKQETASLQQLLQARDADDPELLSGALEQALAELQQASARKRESIGSLAAEQRLAHQLEESAERSEALAAQVRQQLEANSSLRTRLMTAVEAGEQDQTASANQINELQAKLKRLEDTITSAQIQSETAVMKHEEEVRNLKQSHNAQLQRAKAGLRSPNPNSGGKSPLSPMFANSKRSPRLDQTTSGPGQTLNQAMKTEFLQKKVGELEKALSEAETGMEEVVGRMNQAQIGVFELQQERDEALKRTRQLEADVKAERDRFQMLITGGVPGEEYTTLG